MKPNKQITQYLRSWRAMEKNRTGANGLWVGQGEVSCNFKWSGQCRPH